MLLLTLSITVVLGLPTGAPDTACTNGLMPNHGDVNNMATGDVPFIVNISNIGSYYVPGDMYESKMS